MHLTTSVSLRYETVSLQSGNPYKAAPGDELDSWLHQHYFGAKGDSLAYSTDDKAAEKLRVRVKTAYGHAVQVGTTSLQRARYFARLESGPSTSTETLAETSALAIARLALVLALRHPDYQ